MTTDTEKTNDKSRRLIDAAVALLAASPNRKMSAVQLNKALFYLDLAALRDEGSTLTGNTYLALQQGPVVARYQERLIGKLEELGLARQLREGAKKPIELIEEPQLGLGPDHRQLAHQVAAWICKHSASELSDISHHNPGWELAFSSRQSNQPKAIDLRIAMQQILDKDPWLDEALDPAFKAGLDDLSLDEKLSN